MKLKSLAAAFVLVSIPCCIFAYLGYQAAGIKHAEDEAKNLAWQKTTFYNSLLALEKLKTNDIEAATKDLQTICFAHAHKVYTSDTIHADDKFLIAFTLELIKYFDTYCTNRADWTRAETFLNEDLEVIKQHVKQEKQSTPAASSH